MTSSAQTLFGPLPIAGASEKSVVDHSALLAMLGDCTRAKTQTCNRAAALT